MMVIKILKKMVDYVHCTQATITLIIIMVMAKPVSVVVHLNLLQTCFLQIVLKWWSKPKLENEIKSFYAQVDLVCKTQM